MNKLLLIYGSVLLSSTAIANDQQNAKVVEVQSETPGSLENSLTTLNISAELNNSTSEMNDYASYELNLNEVAYIEEEPELDLGFDTSDYLPEGFNPYESYFDLNSIIYLENKVELALGFDTQTYLPEDFNSYTDVVDVHSINYMEEEDGENYDDLETMYGHVVAQFRRYMGHVSNNIGGVYEYHKTADQEGAVYTHVSKEHQKDAMNFMQEQLFETPEWLIDQNIFNKIEYSGSVERIRATQERYLNTMLQLGKLARIIENETLNGDEAYGLVEMMRDLRRGIWSETRSGRTIDTYRRNLQKAHIDRLEYLMTADSQRKLPDFGGYRKSTPINTSQSDIRSVARAELNNLKRDIRSGLARISDTMSRYHLQDALERIDLILEPAK